VFPVVGFQQIEPLALTVLYVLTLLAMLGIWMPALQKVQNKRVVKTIYIAGACLLGLMFVLFWITQWPQWQIPVLLTSIVVLMFIGLFVFSLIEKRKSRLSSG
jgi:predicted membrane channel-forming protein YqfA (hemolysin III family)